MILDGVSPNVAMAISEHKSEDAYDQTIELQKEVAVDTIMKPSQDTVIAVNIRMSLQNWMKK